MKSLARSFVYWPSMDKQIEEYVRNCSKCMLASKEFLSINGKPHMVHGHASTSIMQAQ